MDKALKGIIYYSDNRLDQDLFVRVQKQLLKAGLPIVSATLEPTDFGDNIVVEGKRSYPTMAKQILTALERSTAKYVFFAEHDVLYHPSHFDFTPKEDNIFYYNANVWRWRLWDDKAIRYERMLPLSCLCVNREFAVDHYRMRMEKIEEWGLDKERGREPRWARLWGYEPGTKKKKRGGFTDDDFDTWYSDLPTIDVRHKLTFSRPKVSLDEFKHAPKKWEEISIDKISGWNLPDIA